MSNKVLITNDQNVVKVPSGLRILIRRSCNAVLDFEHFDGPAEISVTFVDNNRIHELNKEYRDKDSATDVLSFPLGENGEYDIDEDNGCKLLGDIVISMERAMEQAELYGHSLAQAVNGHGVAGRKVDEVAQALGRAFRVDAPQGGFILQVYHRCPAGRADPRHVVRH